MSLKASLQFKLQVGVDLPAGAAGARPCGLDGRLHRGLFAWRPGGRQLEVLSPTRDSESETHDSGPSIAVEPALARVDRDRRARGRAVTAVCLCSDSRAGLQQVENRDGAF